MIASWRATSLEEMMLRRRIGQLALVLSVALGVGVCHAAGETDAKVVEHGRFFIDVGEDAGRDLLRKARALKEGDSVSHVKSVFGEPTDDRKLVGKKGEFHGRVMSYYIRRLDRDLVNETLDRYVSCYFDDADKLTGVGYKLSDQPETQGSR